ncbi:hypothetical protein D1872_294640 [compost metagenome]
MERGWTDAAFSRVEYFAQSNAGGVPRGYDHYFVRGRGLYLRFRIPTVKKQCGKAYPTDGGGGQRPAGGRAEPDRFSDDAGRYECLCPESTAE